MTGECHSMDRTSKYANDDRQGVALIIVIGMLALMMIMGVTFAIFMRSERAAAGNFRNDVQARELLQCALSRSIETLETSIGTAAYPPWDVLPSTFAGGVTNNGILTDSISNMIPSSVLATITAGPQWIDLTAANSNLEGRISFLVLNCSGLLDANYAGGAARAMGTNASEIDVASMPGTEVPSTASLLSGRTYANVQDLNTYMAGAMGAGWLSKHFVTYSAVPTNGLVEIGGTVQDLVNKHSEIISALALSGIMGAQAETVFTNLCDYVDDDCIPGNCGSGSGDPDGPCVDLAPMVNELGVSNVVVVTSNAGALVVSGQMFFDYEVLFPFTTNAPSGKFTIDLNAQIVASDPAFAPTPPNYVTNVQIRSYNNGYSPVTRTPLAWGWSNSLASLSSANISMQATITASVKQKSDGTIVDRVKNVPLSWSIPLVNGGGMWFGSSMNYSQCDDPRLNYSLARWSSTNAPSIGMENSVVSRMFKNTPYADGDLEMYVKNGPLATVGELGYLFIGVPGQTIRLYQHTASVRGSVHKVLDNFSVGVGTNLALKGRVNLNSKNQEVLDAVFAGVPINSPHGRGDSRADSALVGAIAGAITTKSSTSQFAKLSDIGALDWATLFPSAKGSDQDRESLIRNTADLLTVRHNYFLILLHAQTTKQVPGLPDRSVVTGLHGIAEVWRDPLSGGNHFKFVRGLRILNN